MKKVIWVIFILVECCIMFRIGWQYASKEETFWAETDWLDEKLDLNTPTIISSEIIPLSSLHMVDFQAHEYVYTTLNDMQKKAYRKIISSIEQYREKEYIDMEQYTVICMVDLSEYGLTEDELMETFWSVLSDHTELFFVKESFCCYAGENETVLYVLASEEFVELEDRREVYDALEKYRAEIIVGTEKLNSTEEKIQYVFNCVKENLVYAENEKTEPIVNDITASIACLVDGQAICAGYAKVFSYLLNAIDVPSIYVVGYVEGGLHAWNYVQLDNMYFGCDCTFSDAGVPVYLKGSSIYATHVPLRYGINTYDFCYPLPELSVDNYEENIQSDDGNDCSIEEIDKEENVETEMEQSKDMGEELCEPSLPVIVLPPEEIIPEEAEPEENNSEQTITSVVTVPVNPDRDTWVDIGSDMQEMQIQIGGENVTVWKAPVIPDDTMYLIDGEPYINGKPADLYYIFKAQELENPADKINNYLEAIKYAPENMDLYFNLGYCYDKCGDYSNSFSYYLHAIQKGDQSGAVDNILYVIDKYKIDVTEREAAYQIVAEIVPDDPRVRAKLSN